MTSWDEEFDVVVVGSGAGGLLAALVSAANHASVLIVEKANEWGGTSATSGGGIWIPGSDQAKAAGFDDDLDDAFRYVRALSADNVPDELIRAYVDNGAKMLRWVTANTEIVYNAQPYTDYHPENPGGSPTGYRTHLPDLFDGSLLGEDLKTQRLISPAACFRGYLNWTFTEIFQLLYRSPGWATALAKNLAKFWLDLPLRFTSMKDRRLTSGNALTGGLKHALNKLDVPLWLNTPMQQLVFENGEVTGIVVKREGRSCRIRARKGVVLAAGGFDKSQAMRDAHSPLYPNAYLSGGVTSNTGDGIVAAQTVGAGTMNMHSAWAAPVFLIPGEDRGRLVTIERALPGCIMVNQKGKRYLNEAASYHVVGQQMARQQADFGDASPSWMIFDARYRHLFPMGPLYPLLPDWLHGSGIRKILKKAPTIGGLARELGMEPAVLEGTITRYHQFAEAGEDGDFHRGASAYDRMYGDPRNQPNPCLRAPTEAPFYAMPIYPGDIGTNGGLVTNAKANVLAEDGKPIRGLYALGNNAASAMGESYPGAGVTIGPAMTFAYVAACDMTGANT